MPHHLDSGIQNKCQLPSTVPFQGSTFTMTRHIEMLKKQFLLFLASKPIGFQISSFFETVLLVMTVNVYLQINFLYSVVKIVKYRTV